MSGNYYRKLSASTYHPAKNVGIIGILAYPKTLAKKLHIQKVHPCHILFLSSNFVNNFKVVFPVVIKPKKIKLSRTL